MCAQALSASATLKESTVGVVFFNNLRPSMARVPEHDISNPTLRAEVDKVVKYWLCGQITGSLLDQSQSYNAYKILLKWNKEFEANVFPVINNVWINEPSDFQLVCCYLPPND